MRKALWIGSGQLGAVDFTQVGYVGYMNGRRECLESLFVFGVVSRIGQAHRSARGFAQLVRMAGFVGSSPPTHRQEVIFRGQCGWLKDALVQQRERRR